MEIEAYGKINLALDILRKREDGYHEIKSIMQQISLSDILSIVEGPKGVSISCANQLVPLDETNLVYRAWEAMAKIAGTKSGIRVHIEKRIPVAAGLAGGSTNGAATMTALNQMWDIGLSLKELMDIGLKLGADLPFCLLGGTALAEGIGEKLTPLKSFSGKHVLIVNPGFPISTAYAYSRMRIRDERLPMEQLTACIENNDLICLANSLDNVMEDAIIPEHPIIGQIKEEIIEAGALGALMSGSGASVFGLFDDDEKLKFAYKKLHGKVPVVYKVNTI